jgi:thiol-disulfide isomerase/thioredoxin
MDSAALATLINAYHQIVRATPARQPGPWGFVAYFFLRRHPVAGHRWSLWRLEREIRGAGDPRVHFALNCGAASCPPIREYAGEPLDAQLDLATRAYLAVPGNIRWEPGTSTLYLSALFRWYRGDFGDPALFVGQYLPPGTLDARPHIRYLSWDWTPTGQGEAPAAKPEEGRRDRLSMGLVVALLAFLAYLALLPRQGSPLGSLAGRRLASPGHVTLIELGQTDCPACWAMKPVLAALGHAYGHRIAIETLDIDRPGDLAETRRLVALSELHFTPTLLLADRQGRASAKFVGTTSYLSLSQAIDRVLKTPDRH